MNKSELVDAVASHAGVSKSEAEGVLNAFFDTVKSEAKGGNAVGWPGFGKFSPSARAARTARNPQTGASVKVKAQTGMKFRPSSVLKTFLNAKGTTRKTTANKAAAPAARATAAATRAPASTASAKKASSSTAAAKKTPTARAATGASKATATKAPARKASTAKATATASKATARKAPAKRAAVR